MSNNAYRRKAGQIIVRCRTDLYKSMHAQSRSHNDAHPTVEENGKLVPKQERWIASVLPEGAPCFCDVLLHHKRDVHQALGRTNPQQWRCGTRGLVQPVVSHHACYHMVAKQLLYNVRWHGWCCRDAGGWTACVLLTQRATCRAITWNLFHRRTCV